MQSQDLTAQEQAEGTAFIRIARVKLLSGLSKSTLKRWIDAGRFPKPVIEEGNTVMWDLAECLAWRAAQFKKRDERAQQAQATSA